MTTKEDEAIDRLRAKLAEKEAKRAAKSARRASAEVRRCERDLRVVESLISEFDGDSTLADVHTSIAGALAMHRAAALGKEQK